MPPLGTSMPSIRCARLLTLTWQTWLRPDRHAWNIYLTRLAACPGPPTVALAHANLTAAYITLVAASVPYPDVDGPMGRAQCLTMPPGSRLHKLTRAADDEPDTPCSRQSHQAASRASSESLDEAWLRDDTPPPCLYFAMSCHIPCVPHEGHMLRPMPARQNL